MMPLYAANPQRPSETSHFSPFSEGIVRPPILQGAKYSRGGELLQKMLAAEAPHTIPPGSWRSLSRHSLVLWVGCAETMGLILR